GVAAGTARGVSAAVEDAAGNTVTSGGDSSVSVGFGQTGGAGSVAGTGSATASGGVATRTVTGNLAGSVSLQATATLSGPGSTSSNAVSFAVVFGAASQVVLS